MQDVLRPWTPAVLVQRVEDGEQVVGREVWLVTDQPVGADRRRIAGVQHDHIVQTVFRDADQEVAHQVALRVDNYHPASGPHVLQRQIRHERGLTDTGWPDEVQVPQ